MLTKKTLLFLLSTTVSLHAMKKEITNDDLVKACQTQSIIYVNRILQLNPHLDINYCNEHGTTPLLSAASAQTNNCWTTAQELLKRKKINYLHKDNYEQSLFSKAIYSNLCRTDFRNILIYYTLDQINNECKNLPYDRNSNLELHTITPYDDSTDNTTPEMQNYTKLCAQHHHLPLIKKQFLDNTPIDKINTFNKLNYYLNPQRYSGRIFYRHLSHKITFALREAFNYGPHSIPNYATLLQLFINNTTSTNEPLSTIVQFLPTDTINTIKAYIAPTTRYQNIERNLWEKALKKAQQFSTIKEKDPSKFINMLMQLSRQEKTKLNIKVYMDMDCEPCKL